LCSSALETSCHSAKGSDRSNPQQQRAREREQHPIGSMQRDMSPQHSVGHSAPSSFGLPLRLPGRRAYRGVQMDSHAPPQASWQATTWGLYAASHACWHAPQSCTVHRMVVHPSSNSTSTSFSDTTSTRSPLPVASPTPPICPLGEAATGVDWYPESDPHAPPGPIPATIASSCTLLLPSKLPAPADAVEVDRTDSEVDTCLACLALNLLSLVHRKQSQEHLHDL